MMFVIPDNYAGKTLRDIQNSTGLPFRADVLANFLGIRDDTPLTAGQTFNLPNDPGSGEVQAAQRIFKQTTPEQLAQDIANKKAQELIDAGAAEVKRDMEAAKTLFGPDNPFVFDEYLAKESASQEYLPYYTELLQDYLDKVGVSKDTVQNTDKLLKELKTTSKGTAGAENRSYEQAISQAEQGFAGQGMFFSGIKSRAIGRADVARNYSVGTTATEASNQYRDIFGTGRGYETALAGGVEQRRGEQMKEYYTPRVNTYLREFPGKSDYLQGYVPSEFLRY